MKQLSTRQPHRLLTFIVLLVLVLTGGTLMPRSGAPEGRVPPPAAPHTTAAQAATAPHTTTPPLRPTQNITTTLDPELRGMVIRDPWYDFGTYPGRPNEPDYATQDRMGRILAELGVRWVRMEFLIEGGNPITTTHVARYDYFINEVAPRHNLKILGLLSFGLLRGVPPCDLASDDTWNDGVYGGGTNYYMQAWLYRARMIVDRYQGRIAAYQVLNEQNRMTPNCDYIPPVEAARLHTKFYRFFRQVDRDASGMGSQAWRDDIPIIMGAIHPAGTRDPDDDDYVSDRQYLREMYQTEAFSSYHTLYERFPIDGVGYHPYPEEIRNSPQSDVDFINVRLGSVRRLLEDIYAEEDEDAPPFWITEVGYNAAFRGQSEEEQAEFMRSALLELAARDDVHTIFWFKYEDFPPASGPNAQKWGVVRIPFVEGDCPGGFCYDIEGRPSLRRPAFWVYRELTGRGGVTPEPPANITITTVPTAPDYVVRNTPITITASISRTTASRPFTYIWEATDHRALTRTAGLSDTIVFSWNISGTKVITTQAINDAGVIINTHTLTVVNERHTLFLPVLPGKTEEEPEPLPPR